MFITTTHSITAFGIIALSIKTIHNDIQHERVAVAMRWSERKLVKNNQKISSLFPRLGKFQKTFNDTQRNDSRHNDTQHIDWKSYVRTAKYVEYVYCYLFWLLHWAWLCWLSFLSAIMLSGIMLIVIMLSVIMLSIVMLGVFC